MAFCYPKLSKLDLLVCRLGGPGLGNLLFPWARAKVLAQQHGHRFVPPAWPQLKLGPLVRGELDSRSYFSLFRNLSTDVRGFRRLMVLLIGKRILENQHLTAKDGDVIVIEGMAGMFNSILPHSEFLRGELIAMLQLNRLPELGIKVGASGSIAVHVRFGDFSAVDQSASRHGESNCRQPIEWYVAAVDAARAILGENMQVNVFSDAADGELKLLLGMSNVRRVDGNSAIEDILLISRHQLLIASGSTFSMWASFLGQMLTIWFPGQKKSRQVRQASSEVEFEPGSPLPSTFALPIRLIGSPSE